MISKSCQLTLMGGGPPPLKTGVMLVPSCTFELHFPERRLADGRAVRTYEDLVEWLSNQSWKVGHTWTHAPALLHATSV